MNLHQQMFTENPCYQAGRTITPKGIMVHSTGANNPDLRRYVAPDDGLLGENRYHNHWNQKMTPGVCVHAFIGRLKDGSVATYQTLPWTCRGWHAGGDANNTHISFEICEDGLTDPAYFAAVYREAAELCAYLCKLYGLTEKDVICHAEGHQKGIASNHGDVLHWFPKQGKTMEDFRQEVKQLLGGQESAPAEPSGKGGYDLQMRVLKKGAKGEDVRAMQLLLMGRGFSCGSCGADGSFGGDTDRAVRAYQKAKGLAVDGSAGPATMGSLLGLGEAVK